MRGTAGFLKLGATIALVFEVLGIALMAIAEVFLLMAGSFSELAKKSGNAITISGGTMSPAEMDKLKPVVLIGIAIGIVALIFALIGTLKTRTALSECQKERPFSEKCVKALLSSARIQIIGGIVGIAGTLVFTFLAKDLTVNGKTIGSQTTTLNLTFLVQAIQTYLFYHVAKYGQSLENR